ncbi:hypothetical protein X275_07580 [Marinitoga sp. 1197]|uniref:hypothetical protein n=1 Tax=unclassified Marinitoga TaxID=2640159 RepID=UPI000640D626|nr:MULTISPECIES: hypothetical protein [unclassified Marinitoga]KLO21913.1 hypothetical protein X275_07580 [Marinitoga sp. 1197]KLO23004.1 hypothetical protein X274_07040 [Marinitoga sp. 1155]NUV00029.1 hypothetical protein [Marinitoga sp. 1154]
MKKTTKDLNMYIKVEQKYLVKVLDKLRKNKIFSKFFPLGGFPIIAISNEDEEIVEQILKNMDIKYEIKKTKTDIIEEMLKF